MKRMLILVGVGQTGGDLVKLKSIESSFRVMKEWANDQKFENVFELSDLDGSPVYLKDISECIENLDNLPHPPEQLVVYFNGHGLHNAGGDLWLLSKAPNQPSEAVNLYSSVVAAYYRNFKHVVLITDACRVPPTNLKFANVTGGSIFQNTDSDGESKAVDQFFAATIGDPAIEVDIQGVPCSIYTSQLAEFLRGMEPALLEMMHAPDALPKVVRPRPLKDALKTAVRARLIKNNINQNTKPDAILSSDPTMWLSSFDQDPAVSGYGSEFHPSDFKLNPETVAPPTAPPRITRGLSIPSVRKDEGESAGTARGSSELQLQLRTALRSDVPTTFAYREHEPWIPEGFHFETACGFLLRGAEAAQAKLNGPGNVYSDQGAWVRFEIAEPRLALVTLRNGNGFLFPAIPGHVGFIEFAGSSIQNLAYEPSANYGQGYDIAEARYQQFNKKQTAIRDVRETFSSAASSGDLRLAVLSSDQMNDAMSIAAYSDEDVDLILLVLLGYSCAASGKHKDLIALCDACLQRLGFLAFDLYLLAMASPAREMIDVNQNVLPPFPIAAQGWAMLEMAPPEIQKELADHQNMTLESPWTLLNSKGVEFCKRYIQEAATESAAAASA